MTGRNPEGESATGRRRRLIDGARVLPAFGAVLLIIPALTAAGVPGATARVGIYIFGIWALLILAAFLLSGRLADASSGEADTGGRGAPPDDPG